MIVSPVFSPNALKILEKRYLRKDTGGNITETPAMMLERVARDIASADMTLYGQSPEATEKTYREFYEAMAGLLFLPNSPAFMNAGTSVRQLSACFVLPVEDSLDKIFDAVKYSALIHKSGGGTGFDFSRLRPRSDIVGSTGGEASGPVSFMKIFNSATEEVRQGGKRRGANMGVLRVDHPDILEFISCKDIPGGLRNFNISVALTHEFMKAYQNDLTYSLYNPRNSEVIRVMRAREVFGRIVHQAWKNGEPGLLFIDTINDKNTVPKAGRIESTNPCGEQPLLPYESCVLGSINLERFVSSTDYDYDSLKKTVYTAVHFLDNIIDINVYPLPKIKKTTVSNRKIGIGIMGFANSLILMGISYDSDEAVAKAREVMNFIDNTAKDASSCLALSRGSFKNHRKSVYKRPMRNATVTTIAPTGTISVLADTSAGIEPLFGIVYKAYRADTEFYEVNPLFRKAAAQYGILDDRLLDDIYKNGSLKDMHGIPSELGRLFVTSHDIGVSRHIEIQAAFQEHTDNAVSKTINLPEAASVEAVREAFVTAYEKGCKGITVYRDTSRPGQVFQKYPSS